jgi:type II secretory pathway pseudopilin PulG
MLASVVLSSLSNARTKGEVATELRQLKALQTAFELYRSDTGLYPPAGVDICTLCGYRRPSASSWSPSDWMVVADALVAAGSMSKPVYQDVWGNYYAYDDNYKHPAWTTSYPSETRGVPTVLCSVGPNRVLETYVDGSVYPEPVSVGDDLCLFFADSD